MIMKQLLAVIVGCIVLNGCKTTTPEVDPNVIAQKYCDSIKNGDYETFRSLFFFKDKIFTEERQNEEWFLRRANAIYDLEIVSASIPYIDIKFSSRPDGFQRTQTIYVMDDGLIKCDPFCILHSTEVLVSSYGNVTHKDLSRRQGGMKILESSGVSLHKYDLNATPEENSESLERIKEWLINNLSTYDRSKFNLPSIPPSETDLKNYDRRLNAKIKR